MLLDLDDGTATFFKQFQTSKLNPSIKKCNIGDLKRKNTFI